MLGVMQPTLMLGFSADRNEIVLHGCTKFSFLLNPVLITAGAVRIIGADYTS